MIESNLPDISPLSQLPRATWSEFGHRLRECGVDKEFGWALWPGRLKVYENLRQAIMIWRARRLHEPKAIAYRIFVLHDPVSDQEAVAMLGSNLMRQLLSAGALVRTADKSVVSLFELRLFRNLYVLCDDVSHGGQAVFAAGPGTQAFPGLINSHTHVSRALDLGCGAGAVALWLSKHAELVHATDINPRALEFLKINAGINEITNVEGFLGDWFAAVSGRQYDLILSQPPFVPCPPQTSAATYRHGGRHGHETAQAVLREAPKFLAPNGRAMVVFEHPSFNDDERSGPQEADWVCRSNVKTLLLLGRPVDADAYSVRYAVSELKHGLDSFDTEAARMRDHLDALNIQGVHTAICILEATTGKGWFETVEAGEALWNEVSPDAVNRLFTGISLVHEKPDLSLRAALELPSDSLVIQGFRSNDKKNEKILVALPAGYIVQSLEFTAPEWEILQHLMDGDSLVASSPALTLQTILKLLCAGVVDTQRAESMLAQSASSQN